MLVRGGDRLRLGLPQAAQYSNKENLSQQRWCIT